MRKFLAALCLLPFVHATASPGVSLHNKVTQQVEAITSEQVDNPDLLKQYLPDITGAELIFDAYVANGYQPLHAVIFTNWDVVVGLSKVTDQTVDNKARKNVQDLLDLYVPVK